MGKSVLMGAGASGLGLLGQPFSAAAYSSKINEVLVNPDYPAEWPFRYVRSSPLGSSSRTLARERRADTPKALTLWHMGALQSTRLLRVPRLAVSGT